MSAEELLEKYSNMVYRLAYARTGNVHDAQDIVQEVFLKYIKADKEVHDEEHRKAWLLTVAANTGNTMMKSAWFRHRADFEEAESEDYYTPGIPERSGVYDAVQDLPEKYRVVIHLFYYEELSIKEISAILKTSETNVKSRLFRARDMLKKIDGGVKMRKMRGKKVVLTVVMTAMLAMTGCGSKAEKTVAETTETTTVQETRTQEETAEETKAAEKETESATEETQTEADDKAKADTDFTDLNKLLGKSGDSEEENVSLLTAFADADEETGYIAGTAENIEKCFQALGIPVEDLSQAGMDENDGEDVLFRFTMYNEEALQTIDSGESDTYLTQLEYNDEEFYVLFGSDEAVEYDEAEVYCEEGTTMDYWAVGSIQDGLYMVVPLIAGNEDTGYYFVLSALETVGVDMPNTMTLAEQGISFKTDDGEEGNKAASTTAKLTGDEYIYFEITGVEGDEEYMVVDYDLTNYYPMDVYISDATISVNGEDITDSTVSFFEVEANDTIEDSFFITGYELKAGDEIVIKGMLTDNETLEDIGMIEFPLVLENK